MEASAKIPFIVYYPSKIPNGSVVNNAFNKVDFAPTFLNFISQKIPSEMKGKDFSGLLVNPVSQTGFGDITFMRSTGLANKGNWIAAVPSRYKLVLSRSDEPWLIDMKTLVILSSNNGPVVNDGYKDVAVEKLGCHKPAGPLRGGKYSLYEAGTRLPFIAFWKGKIQPTVSGALISHLDLLSSLQNWLAAKPGCLTANNYWMFCWKKVRTDSKR